LGSVLLVASRSAGLALGTGKFAPLSGQLIDPGSEVNAAYTGRIAGTFSLYGVTVNATGTGRVYTFRKNSANGNETVSPTDSTAGFYQDTTHTDALVAGNTFDTGIIVGSGSPLLYSSTVVFTATIGHSTYWMSNGPFLTVANQTFTLPTYGTLVATTTEAAAMARMKVAGTVSNAVCVVSSNSMTSTTNLSSRLNGVTANLALAITAAATGTFEDTTHSDTVASGDDYNFGGTTGTGSIIQIPYLGVSFTASSGTSSDLFLSFRALYNPAVTEFVSLGGSRGSTTASTTETNNQIQHGFIGACTNMRAHITSNTAIATIAINIRKNTANGNLNLAITAAATGLFEDTTNSDSFIATDNMDYMLSGGTSGSTLIDYLGVTETFTTPTTGGLKFNSSLNGLSASGPFFSDRLAA
jgi:hypothetical protein